MFILMSLSHGSPNLQLGSAAFHFWTFLLLPQHFPGSQTSRPTSSRRSYLICNLRFELKLLIFSHQSNFYLHFYRPLILFHQSKFTETRVIFCDKQIRLRDFSKKLRQLDVIVWDPGKCRPAKGNAAF